MKKITLFTGLIFLSISLFSQNSFLSFNNRNANKETTMPVRLINDHGVNGLRIEYNFPGSIVSNHEVSERTFQFLNIEGFGKLHEVGKPALPAHNDFVSIPNGAEASVNILSIEYKEFDNYLIHPALQLATDTHGDTEPEFEINEDFYNTDVLYPENPVTIGEILKYRGNSIAKVKICPIQYNPLKRKIKVISKIVYEVKFSQSKSFFGRKSVTENFAKIPNGHPAIEHRMEFMYSEGVRKGKISLPKFVEICATNAAKIFGMYPRKGTIAIGSDADIVIFDPKKKHIISAKTHHMRCDYSGYEGWEVTGKTETVLLRGKIAIEDEQCLLNPGDGQFIPRGKTSLVI